MSPIASHEHHKDTLVRGGFQRVRLTALIQTTNDSQNNHDRNGIRVVVKYRSFDIYWQGSASGRADGCL